MAKEGAAHTAADQKDRAVLKVPQADIEGLGAGPRPLVSVGISQAVLRAIPLKRDISSSMVISHF